MNELTTTDSSKKLEIIQLAEEAGINLFDSEKSAEKIEDDSSPHFLYDDSDSDNESSFSSKNLFLNSIENQQINLRNQLKELILKKKEHKKNWDKVQQEISNNKNSLSPMLQQFQKNFSSQKIKLTALIALTFLICLICGGIASGGGLGILFTLSAYGISSSTIITITTIFLSITVGVGGGITTTVISKKSLLHRATSIQLINTEDVSYKAIYATETISTEKTTTVKKINILRFTRFTLAVFFLGVLAGGGSCGLVTLLSAKITFGMIATIGMIVTPILLGLTVAGILALKYRRCLITWIQNSQENPQKQQIIKKCEQKNYDLCTNAVTIHEKIKKLEQQILIINQQIEFSQEDQDVLNEMNQICTDLYHLQVAKEILENTLRKKIITRFVISILITLGMLLLSTALGGAIGYFGYSTVAHYIISTAILHPKAHFFFLAGCACGGTFFSGIISVICSLLFVHKCPSYKTKITEVNKELRKFLGRRDDTYNLQNLLEADYPKKVEINKLLQEIKRKNTELSKTYTTCSKKAELFKTRKKTEKNLFKDLYKQPEKRKPKILTLETLLSQYSISSANIEEKSTTPPKKLKTSEDLSSELQLNSYQFDSKDFEKLETQILETYDQKQKQKEKEADETFFNKKRPEDPVTELVVFENLQKKFEAEIQNSEDDD